MLNKFIDLIAKRRWKPAEVESMLGSTRACYLSHAADADIRAAAASGGTVTALLLHALQKGHLDGAVVCNSVVEDGKVRARFTLAHTPEEILQARGSKYVETRFLKEVLPLLRQARGRYAVCGLPCDLSSLRRWERKEPEAIGSKVALRIALLCGHNSRKELVDNVVCKLRREVGGDKLTGFTFRKGHWRGEMEASFANGAQTRRPFSYFSDYRNLFFHAEQKCLACMDHFGYDADLSFGDVWLYRLREAEIKHTGVLVRTEVGEAIFDDAVRNGAVVAADTAREVILDGQSRIAPTHFNVSARAKAGRLVGVRIPDRHPTKVPPQRYLSALIGLINMRFSQSRFAGVIFRAPRPLIRGYLFFKKGLESL